MYTVLNIFSPFTSFEQLALALEKQSCPENFHCFAADESRWTRCPSSVPLSTRNSVQNKLY